MWSCKRMLPRDPAPACTGFGLCRCEGIMDRSIRDQAHSLYELLGGWLVYSYVVMGSLSPRVENVRLWRSLVSLVSGSRQREATGVGWDWEEVRGLPFQRIVTPYALSPVHTLRHFCTILETLPQLDSCCCDSLCTFTFKFHFFYSTSENVPSWAPFTLDAEE